jgi:hypothetical protein
VDRGDWQLFKLHGSVGWARVLNGWAGIDSANPNDVIAASGGVDFDSGALRPQPWTRAAKGEFAVAAPGIAVPTTLKQSFQCPQAHVDKFTEAIGSVDRLLTVGWRAAEPHVLELFAQRISPGYHLAICDRGSDDIHAIRDNLGLVARKSPDPKAFTGGFTGLLKADHLEQWLSLPAPGQPL